VARKKIEQLLELADVRVNGGRPWDMRVHDERLYPRILAKGTLGLGEAYMDGWWDCDQLDQFICNVVRAELRRQIAPLSLFWPMLLAQLFNLQSLGRAFQVVQPFPEMTVEENVMVGALYGKEGTPYAEARRRAEEALERSGLSALRAVPAEELTLLQEKRLEIARALATDPRVLLLDEVMAGLRPAEARLAVDLVREVRDRGVTVVFIEHVMPVVRDLADRVLVMDYGRPLASGSYRQVTADPRVVEAYLGRDDEEDEA